jgi:sulfate transport system ATP-binding protein
VALLSGKGATLIEIDGPRDRELRSGDLIGLHPKRYRIFAAQE